MRPASARCMRTRAASRRISRTPRWPLTTDPTLQLTATPLVETPSDQSDDTRDIDSACAGAGNSLRVVLACASSAFVQFRSSSQSTRRLSVCSDDTQSDQNAPSLTRFWSGPSSPLLGRVESVSARVGCSGPPHYCMRACKTRALILTRSRRHPINEFKGDSQCQRRVQAA